jgi:hypothetical protein
MALIKLSASERRRLSAFVTCLLLAALAWVFTMLSDTYPFKVKEIITFKNLPQKRAFHALQSDTVVATLKGTGWELLFQKNEYANKTLDVDLHTLENKDYVVLSAQLGRINETKDFDLPIDTISPDTLYFDFTGRTVKKVPVQLVTSLKYQRQFAQSNNAIIDPPFVTISGPQKDIDNIQSWQTDSLKLDSVDETVRTTLALKPVHEASLSIYPRSVLVRVPVDEFTEKTVEIFPLKVKVTFTTSLRRYPELDEDYFEAAADLNLWKNNGYSTLPVKLTRSPGYCKIVKIEPQNIDFIVRK